MTLSDIRAHIKDIAPADEKSMHTAACVAAVEKLARSDQRIAAKMSDWNPDKMLLGAPRHTVDLRDSSLMDPIPTHMINKSTAVDPAESPTCLRWLKFLEEATRGDQEFTDFLQRLCGYALTGLTREQVLCFFYGPGGNGKSVFLNVLKGIAGSYGETAAIQTFMSSPYDPHLTGVAKLDGARVVVASETEEGRKWRTSQIKVLTGGDPVAARFMRQDEFEYLPQFLLMFVGNNAPELGKVDDAIKPRKCWIGILLDDVDVHEVVTQRKVEQVAEEVLCMNIIVLQVKAVQMLNLHPQVREIVRDTFYEV